ncbi:MAG: YlxR family protein [Lachnospiraceae bacterium]|nr:YlxR family protein [Lachnospiraceae bacterium]
MRMCVACRQMFPKNTLLRVVRLEDGTAVIDRTGKRNGRGAYLCATTACFERAMKTRALDRALNLTLSEQTKADLIKELEDAGPAL